MEVSKKTPLYRMIYEDQRGKILNGFYRDGALLPFERELCQQYNVDRVTVRRALQMLVEDGLLEKRTGVGSFVHINGLKKSEAPSQPSQVRRFLYVLSISAPIIVMNPESYNAELFYFLQHECGKDGSVLVYMVENDPQLKRLKKGEYDGCFIISSVNLEVVDYIAAIMPIVYINAVNPKYPSVLVEDENGVYMAVKHLISIGHRRIAMVGNNQKFYTTRLRTVGYRRALRESGIEEDQRYMAFVNDADMDTVACINMILEQLPQNQWPSAFLFHSDLLAVAGILVLTRRGLRVPEDISVIGFNNTTISNNTFPRLTTVDTQRDLVAAESLLLMQRLIQNPQMRRILVSVPAHLVIRESIEPIV